MDLWGYASKWIGPECGSPFFEGSIDWRKHGRFLDQDRGCVGVESSSWSRFAEQEQFQGKGVCLWSKQYVVCVYPWSGFYRDGFDCLYCWWWQGGAGFGNNFVDCPNRQHRTGCRCSKRDYQRGYGCLDYACSERRGWGCAAVYGSSCTGERHFKWVATVTYLYSWCQL